MSDELKVTEVAGGAISIRGNDIDTDRIIPARFLKAITFSELGQYPFHDERFDRDGKEKDHPFNRPERRNAKMLFVNENFGCGSSREHAPQALKRWGVDAVVGISFGEIFAGNCERLGMPALRAKPADIEKLQAAAESDASIEWRIDLDSMTVNGGNIQIPIELDEGRRNSLTQGHWDSTGLLVDNLDKVKTIYEKLPYTQGYR